MLSAFGGCPPSADSTSGGRGGLSAFGRFDERGGAVRLRPIRRAGGGGGGGGCPPSADSTSGGGGGGAVRLRPIRRAGGGGEGGGGCVRLWPIRRAGVLSVKTSDLI